MTDGKRIATASLLACTVASVPCLLRAEDIAVRIDALASAGTLAKWYEPSIFVEFAPPQMSAEFLRDSQRTSGMIALTTHAPLGDSSSLANYLTRLAGSTGVLAKMTAAAEAGAEVLVQIHPMPRWITSAPQDDSLPCADQPRWPTWRTRAPADDKWADWEAVVYETVKFFNVTRGFKNVWYQLWEEPDGLCFWTDGEERFLRLWKHTALGAERADPAVRIGGPGTVGGVTGRIGTSSKPAVQAFIEYSKAESIDMDFVAFHFFNLSPALVRVRTLEAVAWLDANGLADRQIVISSHNPRKADAASPFWAAPPSKLGNSQMLTEMGAAHVLAFARAAELSGRRGYQVMYQLDDHDIGGDFPDEWGARTPAEKGGIRKAIYHGHTLPGRLPRTLVPATITHANPTNEGVEHFHAIAGRDNTGLGVLLWNYVVAPEMAAQAYLVEAGYRAGLQQWPLARLTSFFRDEITVDQVTSVPKEQADLERAKALFKRQRELGTESHRVTLDLRGITSEPTEVRQHLIDETHSNSYYHYQQGGLAAAMANQSLELGDAPVRIAAGTWQISLKPYSVALVTLKAALGPPMDGGADGALAPDARQADTAAPDARADSSATIDGPSQSKRPAADAALSSGTGAGCGCRVASQAPPAGPGWTVVALSSAAIVWRARRRRRRRPRSRPSRRAGKTKTTGFGYSFVLSWQHGSCGARRFAVHPAYFDGHSMSQISSRTGHPLGTIKTRVRLGLSRMREILGAARCRTATDDLVGT